MSDDAALVGAHGDDDNGLLSGSAYVFNQPENNQPPTSAFTYAPKTPTVGEQVTFTATGSTNSDSTIESYAWEFTDDGTVDAMGRQATYTFTAEGEYPVTLTVTDNDGVSAISCQTITVTAPTVFPYPIVINGRTYTPTDVDSDGKYEDINGNGTLDLQDVVLVAQLQGAYRSGRLTLTPVQVDALDFDSDERLTGRDISVLLREYLRGNR